MSTISNSYDVFTLSQTHYINSTQIYHLLVKDPENNQCYSFYFRYNSLKSLHKAAKKAKNNKTYPKNIEFPSRRKTNERLNQLQKYFSNFLPHLNETMLNQTEIIDKKHINFKISKFLEVLGLESILPNNFQMELSKLTLNHLNVKKKNENVEECHLLIKPQKKNVDDLKNPNKSNKNKDCGNMDSLVKLIKEKPKNNYNEISQPNLINDLEKNSHFPFVKQETFDLKINEKNFRFVKEKHLGAGGYGNVSLYSLNGSKEDSHKFAIKSIEFGKDDDVQEKTRKMNSILAESKIFMKFDHENIVKGTHYCYFLYGRKNILNFKATFTIK